MSTRLPPPTPPACLVRRVGSSQKGGTLIAEDVIDVVEHERRLRSPDGYRPSECARCQHSVLHVHDYRARHLRGDPDRMTTLTVRHRCAHPDCGAIWQILPLFLARHLWRTWTAVGQALDGVRSTGARVPERTLRRWQRRLRTSARSLLVVLRAAGADGATALGLDAARAALVAAYDGDLAGLAAQVHRIAPGIRVM